MIEPVRVLMLGDIVGQSGLRALYVGLSSLVRQSRADLVIANGENAFNGFGLTSEIASRLLSSGVNVITTGNHVWQQRKILQEVDAFPTVLRPANYPAGAPGRGMCSVDLQKARVAVINLQGRVRLTDVDCPFQCARKLLRSVAADAKVVIVDFHAEDTEEKESMGLFLDGKVSVVFGTHTHVQTADERILEHGTAYITDVGMTGPCESVIGFDSAVATERMVTQMPLKMVVSDSPSAIRGILVDIDPESGVAAAIERIERIPGL